MRINGGPSANVFEPDVKRTRSLLSPRCCGGESLHGGGKNHSYRLNSILKPRRAAVMSTALSLSAFSPVTHQCHHRRRRCPAPRFSVKSSADKPPPPTTKAATSWVSPDWLTSLTKSLATLGPKDESNIPVASAKLDDVSELLGGALFLPLFKWMNEYGPIYRLAAGPRNFVVVSDPAIAKHVLRNYGTKYSKGLVAEVSEFLFGSGFAIAEGSLWTVIILLLFSFFFLLRL